MIIMSLVVVEFVLKEDMEWCGLVASTSSAGRRQGMNGLHTNTVCSKQFSQPDRLIISS